MPLALAFSLCDTTAWPRNSTVTHLIIHGQPQANRVFLATSTLYPHVNTPAHFLDQHWDGSLPIDPERVADRAGIRVIADPQLSLEGLSGKYAVEDGVPTIRYSPSEPKVRQRFTIAHELGHHALGHPASYRDPAAHFSSTTFDPSETAANRFAAALLMPKDILLFKIGQMSNPGIVDLADAFGVSQVAMHYRLKNLGWLDG